MQSGRPGNLADKTNVDSEKQKAARLNFLNSINQNSIIRQTPYYTFRPLQRHIKVDNVFGSFSECACPDGLFNRHKNQRRQTIEKMVVYETLKRFKKNHTLLYVSLGAGNLLQDYILCAKLLLEGYSLDICLVDTLLSQALIEKLKSVLEKFINGNCQFTVSTFSSVQAYQNEKGQEKINIAVAIDFDSAFKQSGYTSIINLHQNLNEKGFFFIACHEYDYILNYKKTAYSKYHGYDFFGCRPWFDEKEFGVVMKVPEITKSLAFAKDITVLPQGLKNLVLDYAGFIPSVEEIKNTIG